MSILWSFVGIYIHCGILAQLLILHEPSCSPTTSRPLTFPPFRPPQNSRTQLLWLYLPPPRFFLLFFFPKDEKDKLLIMMMMMSNARCPCGPPNSGLCRYDMVMLSFARS
ncbi:uncharacterized protein B0T23DRAFT_32860 [Neurospora hispaniola]|uniref:Uncharacterized protein n=1 Tax=Neurospora hispaniola TaxID=588809 RepID=A0AAJ0IGU4_9PEZI|nr:hypothetical protein B0T23DRAFT_32860 [Neurospora hispaniola]